MRSKNMSRVTVVLFCVTTCTWL